MILLPLFQVHWPLIRNTASLRLIGQNLLNYVGLVPQISQMLYVPASILIIGRNIVRSMGLATLIGWICFIAIDRQIGRMFVCI